MPERYYVINNLRLLLVPAAWEEGMSDYGDFCRDQRNRRFRAKLHHSHLCFTCGTTVWDHDEKCRYCGEPNLSYKPKKEGKSVPVGREEERP